jgi:predicted nuclease with TOPRIM domain
MQVDDRVQFGALKNKHMSDTPRTDAINTNKRLFDLVRYMRSALHEGGLITDKEYAWLCSDAPMARSEYGFSPSAQRLADYDELMKSNAKLERELNAASEKIKRMGRWNSQHWIDIQNLTETIRYRESHIKRLEEAGDAMSLFCADEVSLEQWNDAKKNQSQKENNQ